MRKWAVYSGGVRKLGGKTIFDSRDWHRIFSFSDGLGILCWGHLQVLGTNKTIDEETSHEPQTLGSDDEFPTGNGRFFIVFPHLLEFDVELWASGPFLFPESDAFLSDVPWWKTWRISVLIFDFPSLSKLWDSCKWRLLPHPTPIPCYRQFQKIRTATQRVLLPRLSVWSEHPYTELNSSEMYTLVFPVSLKPIDGTCRFLPEVIEKTQVFQSRALNKLKELLFSLDIPIYIYIYIYIYICISPGGLGLWCRVLPCSGCGNVRSSRWVE